MKNFHLNKEQVNELRAAHRAERNRHAALKSMPLSCLEVTGS